MWPGYKGRVVMLHMAQMAGCFRLLMLLLLKIRSFLRAGLALRLAGKRRIAFCAFSSSARSGSTSGAIDRETLDRAQCQNGAVVLPDKKGALFIPRLLGVLVFMTGRDFIAGLRRGSGADVVDVSPQGSKYPIIIYSPEYEPT